VHQGTPTQLPLAGEKEVSWKVLWVTIRLATVRPGPVPVVRGLCSVLHCEDWQESQVRCLCLDTWFPQGSWDPGLLGALPMFIMEKEFKF
jgi:hypothetical protein